MDLELTIPTTVRDGSLSMNIFSGRLKAELFRRAYGTDLAPDSYLLKVSANINILTYLLTYLLNASFVALPGAEPLNQWNTRTVEFTLQFTHTNVVTVTVVLSAMSSDVAFSDHLQSVIDNTLTLKTIGWAGCSGLGVAVHRSILQNTRVSRARSACRKRKRWSQLPHS